MEVPRWVMVVIIGPLLVAAVANATTAYFQVQAQAKAISELQQIVKTLPTQTDLRYLRQRVALVENQVGENSDRIDVLAQAIAVMRARQNGLSWHPPMDRGPTLKES